LSKVIDLDFKTNKKWSGWLWNRNQIVSGCGPRIQSWSPQL